MLSKYSLGVERMSNKKYDAIIIGGGIGGLTTAGLLAKNGMKVALLEKESQFGGYLSSFSRDGFIFNSTVHNISESHEGATVKRVLVQLGIRDLEIIPLNPTDTIRINDFEITLKRDRDLFFEELISAFPGERENLAAFLKLQDELNKATIKLYVEKFLFYNKKHTINEVLAFEEEYRKKFYETQINLSGNKPINEVLDGYFKNDTIKALFIVLPPLYRIPVYNSLMVWSLHLNGLSTFKGGSRALTNALVRAAQNFGGELYLNSKVIRVFIKNKKAVGVLLENGDQIEGKYIISNISPNILYYDLLGRENLNFEYNEVLEKAIPAESNFIVHLGVKTNLEARGFKGQNYHYYPTSRIHDLFKTIVDGKEFPENFGIMIVMPTLKDSSLAPPENHVVSIHSNASYKYANEWYRFDQNKYKELKESISEKIIRRAEEVIPGLSNNIITKEIVSPITLEKYTNNLKGSSLGWSMLPEQMIWPIEQITPIQNLFLVGHWTHPGGGVPGVMISALTISNILKWIDQA